MFFLVSIGLSKCSFPAYANDKPMTAKHKGSTLNSSNIANSLIANSRHIQTAIDLNGKQVYSFYYKSSFNTEILISNFIKLKL